MPCFHCVVFIWTLLFHLLGRIKLYILFNRNLRRCTLKNRCRSSCFLLVLEKVDNNASPERSAISGRFLRYQWCPEHLFIPAFYKPCQQDPVGPPYWLCASIRQVLPRLLIEIIVKTMYRI